MHVYYCRRTVAVLRVKACCVHIHIAYGLCFKNREKPDGVKRIVNSDTVEVNTGLRWRTTAYIQLAALVAGEYYPGYYLQVLRHIRFAACAR